eukprot:328578-Rhodomonas_salina.3
MVLCACYARSGTELAYDATSASSSTSFIPPPAPTSPVPISLRACYAKSGTEVGCAAVYICLCVSGTKLACAAIVRATRCPVLT